MLRGWQGVSYSFHTHWNRPDTFHIQYMSYSSHRLSVTHLAAKLHLLRDIYHEAQGQRVISAIICFALWTISLSALLYRLRAVESHSSESTFTN